MKSLCKKHILPIGMILAAQQTTAIKHRKKVKRTVTMDSIETTLA